MKKVAVITANTRWFNAQPYIEPISALPLLAAELEGFYNYTIIDCNGQNLSEEQLSKELKNLTPDIVLISALTYDFHMHHERIAELSKKIFSSVKTVMGGVYATTCYEHIMENKSIDYVMIGHAEGRLCQFIDAVLSEADLSSIPGICFRKNDKVVVNPISTFIGDLDTLLSPNYSKIDLTPYLDNGYRYGKEAKRELPILTSYGCPHNCLFCAVRLINGKKVAYREVEDVIDEMKYLKEKYKIDSIAFADDNFLADEQRAKKLLNRMLEEKFNFHVRLMTSAAWHLKDDVIELLEKVGCYSLGLSIESGCDRVLHKIIRKPLKKDIVPDVIRKCQERGIHVSANIVIGFPGETWDEIRESIAFGELCNPDMLNIHIATVLPKTDLYIIAKQKGYLPDDFDFFNKSQRVAAYSRGCITTEEFTPDELEILRTFEWDRINFATKEKRENFCEFRGITEEELAEYRRTARLSIGKSFGFRKKVK